jgi:type II secretory pathway component PulL
VKTPRVLRAVAAVAVAAEAQITVAAMSPSPPLRISTDTSPDNVLQPAEPVVVVARARIENPALGVMPGPRRRRRNWIRRWRITGVLRRLVLVRLVVMSRSSTRLLLPPRLLRLLPTTILI